MSQNIPQEINQVAGPVTAAAPRARAMIDRRRAAPSVNGTAAPRRRRRGDAFAAIQQQPLSWGSTVD